MSGNERWNYSWSPEVHHRFKETLHFYFIDITPFDIVKVAKQISELCSRHGISSVHANAVFGSKDVAIKVWLHPVRAIDFESQLRAHIPGIRDFEHLEILPDVSARSERVPANPQSSFASLLNKVDETTVIAVQSGSGDSLFEDLLDANLLSPEEPASDHIKYFLKISLPPALKIGAEKIQRALSNFWSTHGKVKNAGVYLSRRKDIIIEAETADYFTISKNMLHVHEKYSQSDTETFLCIDNGNLHTDHRIGESTIDALQGIDVYVQSIIPEVYMTPSVEEYEYNTLDVEERSARAKQIISSTQIFKDKDYLDSEEALLLLREYCLTYLHNDLSKMDAIIYILFKGLERYFRSNVKEYIGRLCDKKKINEALSYVASSQDRNKHISLGKYFDIYRFVMDLCDSHDRLPIFESYGAFTQVRNLILHGAFVLDNDNWKDPLEACLKHHSEVQELISMIHEITGNPYTGDFFT